MPRISKEHAARNRKLFREFDNIAQEMGLSYQERVAIMGCPQPNYAAWMKGRAPSDHLKLSIAKGRLMALRAKRMRSNGSTPPVDPDPDMQVELLITDAGEKLLSQITDLVLRSGGTVSLRRASD